MIRRSVAILLLLFSSRARADHLPDRLLAQGRAETALAGIDIHRTRVRTLIERLGKPSSYKKYPETEEAAEIRWDKNGSIVHATINADDVAYAVELSGKPGPLNHTGGGLALGGTFQDLTRIYGSKLVHRDNEVDLQWKDGTEMRVKFESKRIVSILLLANVE